MVTLCGAYLAGFGAGKSWTTTRALLRRVIVHLRNRPRPHPRRGNNRAGKRAARLAYRRALAAWRATRAGKEAE